MATSELITLYQASCTSSIKTAHKGMLHFLAHSQNREKQLLALSCLSVRPSARMEQLGSQWIDCLNFTLEDFSKPVVKIQLLFKNPTRITGILNEYLRTIFFL
jgi:hypothetical protein